VDDASTIDQIKAFFDKKKIMTIFMKYIPPTMTFLQPTYTCKVSPAYTGSVDIDDLKQSLYTDFNNQAKFNSVVYFTDINNILEGYDEIDNVVNYSYKAKFKVKNSDAADDWIYVRSYTRFASNISTTLSTDSGNFAFTTDGTNVKIDGYTVGEVNQALGLMKFKNKNVGGTQYFTDSYFYIDGVSFDGFKLNIVKDHYAAFEKKADISISLI